MTLISLRLWAAALLLAASLASAAAAENGQVATAWQNGDHTRARLIAGGRPDAGNTGVIAAGIEIGLAPSWKTYWRNPGSSGVPPRIEWKASRNVAALEARFPAPRRLAEVDGDVIGYLDDVVFPLIVRPDDPTKPVVLDLVIEYGVCKDLCIPVEMALKLELPVDTAHRAVPDALAASLLKVPRDAAARRPTDPALKAVTADLASAKPTLAAEVDAGSGSGEVDLFLEAPDGLWIPMARKVAVSGTVTRFVVDLADGADIPALKGRSIRATMVAPGGASEASFRLE